MSARTPEANLTLDDAAAASAPVRPMNPTSPQSTAIPSRACRRNRSPRVTLTPGETRCPSIAPTPSRTARPASIRQRRRLPEDRVPDADAERAAGANSARTSTSATDTLTIREGTARWSPKAARDRRRAAARSRPSSTATRPMSCAGRRRSCTRPASRSRMSPAKVVSLINLESSRAMDREFGRAVHPLRFRGNLLRRGIYRRGRNSRGSGRSSPASRDLRGREAHRALRGDQRRSGDRRARHDDPGEPPARPTATPIAASISRSCRRSIAAGDRSRRPDGSYSSPERYLRSVGTSAATCRRSPARRCVPAAVAVVARDRDGAGEGGSLLSPPCPPCPPWGHPALSGVLAAASGRGCHRRAVGTAILAAARPRRTAGSPAALLPGSDREPWPLTWTLLLPSPYPAADHRS